MTGNAGTMRGAGLVRRLLHGAGRLSVMPYATPALTEVSALAHRWSASRGRLLVACWSPDPLAWSSIGRLPIDVRLQIDKMAELAQVRIVSGSVHALAELRVLCEAELMTLDPDELGPLTQVAAGAGAVICEVRLDRLLLHSAGRVEHHDPEALADEPAFPVGVDEISATDVVLDCGELALARLSAAVLDGLVPGESVRVAAQEPSCEHLLDKIFVVDISSRGVMLLVTGREGAGLVCADFARPVASIHGLRRALVELLVGDPAGSPL